MVGHMVRIVRMPIPQLWNPMLECVQHIQVSSRVEVGRGKRSGGVQDRQLAEARAAAVGFLNDLLKTVSEVDNFPLLMSLDLHPLHRNLAFFRAPVFATWSVQTAVGRNQPFHGFAPKNVGFDDFIDIGRGHTPVPDCFRINHNIGSVLALVEATCFIRSHLVLQPTLRQLLLKNPLQLALAAWIAGTTWMSFRPLVDADKNVLLELRHTNNLTDFDGNREGSSPGIQVLTSGRSQLAISYSATLLRIGEIAGYSDAGTLSQEKPPLPIIFEPHKFGHRGTHRG